MRSSIALVRHAQLLRFQLENILIASNTLAIYMSIAIVLCFKYEFLHIGFKHASGLILARAVSTMLQCSMETNYAARQITRNAIADYQT